MMMLMMMMMMMMMRSQAVTPGVTHGAAYHRPLDGYFYHIHKLGCKKNGPVFVTLGTQKLQ